MPRKVLIIGGLGFIGYHIRQELSSADLDIFIAYRNTPAQLPSDAKLIQLNIQSETVDSLRNMIQDFQYILFCGGADDRQIPTEDAFRFYYGENVVPCKKLVEATQGTKVEKVLILGSYFTHFNRTRPRWKMAERHPYVKSRMLQQSEVIPLADRSTEVSVIEIPYVFGATPEKIPLWKPLIQYIDRMPIIFYTKGGTNIMSVEQLAQAIKSILNTSVYQPHWIVGSDNVRWTELIQMIARALGKKRRVVLLPNMLVYSIGFLLKVYGKIVGKQWGLDPYYFIEVQSSETFLDLEDTKRSLSYVNMDMQQSINETVRACGF